MRKMLGQFVGIVSLAAAMVSSIQVVPTYAITMVVNPGSSFTDPSGLVTPLTGYIDYTADTDYVEEYQNWVTVAFYLDGFPEFSLGSNPILVGESSYYFSGWDGSINYPGVYSGFVGLTFEGFAYYSSETTGNSGVFPGQYATGLDYTGLTVWIRYDPIEFPVGSFYLTASRVPEPSTMLLLGTGLLGLIGLNRWRKA